jgi:redox-sensitive bicupin YhaK (pirin superfamily)
MKSDRPRTAIYSRGDTFSGAEQPINNTGGVYAVAAGRGVVHDERNITTAGIMHQFQLWVDLDMQHTSSTVLATVTAATAAFLAAARA